MKNTITLILLIFIPALLLAQPTLTKAGDFSAGTVLKFQNCDPDGIVPGDSGANKTWDFSGLSPFSDTSTEWIILPSATTYGDSFPTATLVEKYSDGRYVFFNKNASENYLVGFVDSNQNLLIHYPNSATIAKRPMTYHTTVVDSFMDHFTTAGFYFKGSGSLTIRADAYGTLILPNGTYNNVLRVRISRMQADTLVQFGTVNLSTSSTYVWFDSTHTSALLKMDSSTSGSFINKSVAYLLSEGTTGIAKNAKPATFSVYPNPAANEFSFTAKEAGILYITNSLGQLLSEIAITEKQNTISTGELGNGVYCLRYQTANAQVSTKLLIQR